MGDRGGEIKVSSGQTRIVFSVPEKGALLSVRHRESGESLVSGMCDLWVAELEEGELRSGEADRFDYEAQGAGARLTWSFETAGVAIAVDVVPEGETGTITASWSAKCVNAGGMCVREVHFPRFRAADVLTKIMRPACSYWPEIPIDKYNHTDWSETELKAMTDNMIYDGVCDTDGYFGGLYPGSWIIAPYFAAWSEGNEGLYIGAHDPDAFTKTLLWDHRDVGFTYHVPDPDLLRDELAVPYPVVIATFRGDWHHGADIYRNWACASAPWATRGTLADTAPDWARESVAWFYSISDLPLPLEDLLPGLRELFGIEGPIGIHSLSPSEQDHSTMPDGETEPWLRKYKRRQLRIAAEHGFYCFEYRGAHQITKDYPGYEAAKPHAFRWQGCLFLVGPYSGGPGFRNRAVPAGTPGSKCIGTGPDAYGQMIEREEYPLLDMCMGTEYWRQRLLDSVTPCASYGLVGNYLDQVGHNRNGSRCDAVGHGHPVRGGDWYAHAHEEVLHRMIRHYRLMGIPQPLLSHESFIEPLVGLVNAALVEGDLRLLSYLYHPLLLLESHQPYSGVEDLQTLRDALARDFHDGRMPTLALPCSLPGVDVVAVLRDGGDGTDYEAIRMIRHWLKVRSAWLPYLNLGTMRHAPVPAEGSGEIVTSAWENPEGGIALFASNATGTPQKLILDLGTDSRASWRAWLDEREEQIGAGGRFERELVPDETVVIER